MEEPWWETQAKPKWGETRPQKTFRAPLMAATGNFHSDTEGRLVRVRKKTPEELQALRDAKVAKEREAADAALEAMEPDARERRLKIQANTWADIATGCFTVTLVMLLAPAIFTCWLFWLDAQVRAAHNC